MERRTIAIGLAAAAGVSIVVAQVVGWWSATPSWREAVSAVGASIIAAAIPVIGAVLVARRRPGGVAVLVTAALIGLPAILYLGYLLASSRPPEDGTSLMVLHLASQLLLVGAGAAAWGLRDVDRWRWDRVVPSPFVVLGAVVLLPVGATLVSMHGVLFPLAILVSLDGLDLAMLAQLVVMAGLLSWAARLPRGTAGVVVLVLLVPRLSESLVRAMGMGDVGLVLGPVAWLGLAAEAALIATACWWLTRDDDLPARTDVVAPGRARTS